MKIGVDIDDVLASFMLAMIEYDNKAYGTTFVRDDFKSFDLSKTWGGTTEEAIDRVFRFYESPGFKDVGVMEGAKEAIQELKKNHELAVVTARPEILRAATTEWI